MKDKKYDKRLIIPRDDFEEEASEGLGRLSRQEADEDLRELRGRMERRLRRPRMIWLPAAAAAVILLVASAVYVSLFRERTVRVSEVVMTEQEVTDTALIAMAEPVRKKKIQVAAPAEDKYRSVSQAKGEVPVAAEAVPEVAAEDTEEVFAVIEAEEEARPQDVVGEAVPGVTRTAALDKKAKAEEAPAAAARVAATTPYRQASPVGGIEELSSWIRKNIRYPEEGVSGVRQVVVVTFRVAADSTLYDLKAERTPGDLFTEEAFRLLREGPRWIPAMKNNEIVDEEIRISIVFK
jgi:hypothetical protein